MGPPRWRGRRDRRDARAGAQPRAGGAGAARRSRGLEPALAAHKAALEGRVHQLAGTIAKVRGLRADVAGPGAGAGELARLARRRHDQRRFDLPWPWGGERFELRDIRALSYIIGPLGSGKTRLAREIAETLAGAVFLGLERVADDGAAARAMLERDAALNARVERSLSWLVEEGATVAASLTALLVALAAEGPAVLVIDMVEQGLDQATQEALIAYLRRRGPGRGRSSC